MAATNVSAALGLHCLLWVGEWMAVLWSALRALPMQQRGWLTGYACMHNHLSCSRMKMSTGK